MDSSATDPPLPACCDVLVIGGGLAGFSNALLLQRCRPAACVVLIESARAPVTTGHSVPVQPFATQFFSRVLRLQDCLAREHLPRHGTCTWFAGQARDRLEDMTVLGCEAPGGQETYHVDVTRLARSIEERARLAGVHVVRGVDVLELRLEWPQNRVRLRGPDGERELATRWIVDASGSSAVLAKHLELDQELPGPGRRSARANWSGRLGFDGLPGTDDDPLRTGRRSFWRAHEFATHDFHGTDWSARLCPHVAGGASLSLTTTRRRASSPSNPRTALEDYSRHVRSVPGLRELLAGAHLEADSFASATRFDWVAARHCGRGWFLVGDAAGPLATPFADPLDWLASDSGVAAELISGDLAGRLSEDQALKLVRAHNQSTRLRDTTGAPQLFESASWMHADASLHGVLLALEHGIAARRARRSSETLPRLSPHGPAALWGHSLRGALSQRLQRLALRRRERGLYGDRNREWQQPVRGGSVWPAFWLATRLWIRIEYAGLRDTLSPIADDEHTNATDEIARRAALARERLRRGSE